MKDFVLIEELARGSKGSVWTARRKHSAKHTNHGREEIEGYPRVGFSGRFAANRSRIYCSEATTEADLKAERFTKCTNRGDGQQTEEEDSLVVLKERRVAELGRGKSVMNEVELLRKVDHPHVVKLLSSFTEKGILWMELEYAPHGDLGQEIARRAKQGLERAAFTHTQLCGMSIQIMSALACLHTNRVVHRDIKSMNIFIYSASSSTPVEVPVRGIIAQEPHSREYVLKIGDLGVGRSCSQNTYELKTFYGTPLYASPEICDNRPYDYRTDLWSCGVLVYEMCELKHPFSGSSLLALAQAIASCKYDPPTYGDETLCEIIQGLIQAEAKKRTPLSQALALLRRDLEDLQNHALEKPPNSWNTEQGSAENFSNNKTQPGDSADDDCVLFKESAQLALTEIDQDNCLSPRSSSPKPIRQVDAEATPERPRLSQAGRCRIEAELKRKRLKLKNLTSWMDAQVDAPDGEFGHSNIELDSLYDEIARLEGMLLGASLSHASRTRTMMPKSASTTALPRPKDLARLQPTPKPSNTTNSQGSAIDSSPCSREDEEDLARSQRRREARLAARLRAHQALRDKSSSVAEHHN